MLNILIKKWRTKWGRRTGKNTSPPNTTNLTLAQIPYGQDALILSIPEHPLMPSFGLRHGKKVKVYSRGCLGGAIVLKVGNRSIAIGSTLAHQIKLSGDFDDGY